MRRAFALTSALSAVVFLALCASLIGGGLEVRGATVRVWLNDWTLIVETGQFRSRDVDWWAERRGHVEFWLDSRVRMFTWQEPGEADRRWSLSVRTILLKAATAVLPTVWAARWLIAFRRFQRWTNAGRCGRCGYDMRASPARCPECGLTVSSAAAGAEMI